MSTEIARYARQILLREVGVAGQNVLQDSSVLVLGTAQRALIRTSRNWLLHRTKEQPGPPA